MLLNISTIKHTVNIYIYTFFRENSDGFRFTGVKQFNISVKITTSFKNTNNLQNIILFYINYAVYLFFIVAYSIVYCLFYCSFLYFWQ